jgi:NitT/TauT family transport system substrate-binding protein
MILQNFSKKDRFPLPVPGRAGCEKEYFMKKILSLLLAFSLALSLAACGGSASSAASSAAVSEAASSAAASEEEEAAAPLSVTEPLRIAGLKGPTTMGLVNLLSMEQAGTAAMDYDLQLYGAADEIVPLLIKGELDMAAIPANLAATLYQKTSGGIQAVAVNTLGVLYVVEQGDTVHSMADLKGRTILSTGKGTTPEYVLRYLLTANGLDPDKDVDIQYYSEATEVTAQMATTQDAIAVLPQPYVTAAGLKDDTLRVALDLTAEWDKVADTQLITGVTVVRKAYAEEHPDVVAAFLADYAQSVNAANTDLDGTAALCEEQGVVAKAAIAKKALPNCNIVCLTGEELKADVSGYLQVLYDADPAAVGGTLPGEDFYWAAQ